MFIITCPCYNCLKGGSISNLCAMHSYVHALKVCCKMLQDAANVELAGRMAPQYEAGIFGPSVINLVGA